MKHKQSRLRVLIIVGGALSIVAIHQATHGPPLQNVPVQSIRWEFQIRPPARWIVVLSQDNVLSAQMAQLQGLQVNGTDGLMTAQDAGLAAIISEPRPSEPTGQFKTTITISARNLPHNELGSQNSGQHGAFTTTILSSLEETFTRISEIQPVLINRMAGSQASYTYFQSHNNSTIDLSTSVVVLMSQRKPRYFLLTLTTPSAHFRHYDRLFKRVVRSFHDDVRPSDE